jgi:hypothetical protein
MGASLAVRELPKNGDDTIEQSVGTSSICYRDVAPAGGNAQRCTRFARASRRREKT